MNSQMRWRIMSLQAVMVLVLTFVAAVGLSLGTFVQGTIHDQLAEQQIFFPDRSTEVTGGALDPAVYPKLQSYAGKQVVDGDTAYAYGNYFIGHHLTAVFVNPQTGKGMTYAEAGAYISANGKNADAATVAKWNGQRDTLFKGEMLRTSLLNAWGWWMLATYTIYASVALGFAALVVLGALVFEFIVARRERTATVKQPAGKVATA